MSPSERDEGRERKKDKKKRGREKAAPTTLGNGRGGFKFVSESNISGGLVAEFPRNGMRNNITAHCCCFARGTRTRDERVGKPGREGCRNRAPRRKPAEAVQEVEEV